MHISWDTSHGHSDGESEIIVRRNLENCDELKSRSITLVADGSDIRQLMILIRPQVVL